VSQLAEEEVAAYRQLEEERIGKVLDDLVELCQSQKVENLLPFQILLFFFGWSSCLLHQCPACQCRYGSLEQPIGSVVFR
jgi:hypothetical protein